MEGQAVVSPEVLAAYAADAAREVPGVSGLVDGGLPRHRGVKVTTDDEGGVRVELRLALEWGTSVADVGRAVQERVAGYLETMADVRPEAVGVVVAELGAPPATP